MALVDGLAPAIASLTMAIPFFIDVFFQGTFEILHLFIIAFIIGGVELFLLGVAIGKVSNRSPGKFGIIMLFMGIIVGLLAMFFENLLEF
ncbi:MAG: hypothetical protein ACXAEU_14980 [Candidatus Hodarchaeales archaeon]